MLGTNVCVRVCGYGKLCLGTKNKTKKSVYRIKGREKYLSTRIDAHRIGTFFLHLNRFSRCEGVLKCFLRKLRAVE